MYTKVAVLTILAVILLAGVGGFLLGVSQQNAEIESLREKVESLSSQLEQQESQGWLRRSVGDLLWALGKIAPYAVLGVALGVGAWSAYKLTERYLHTYYPKQGQLPAVERTAPSGETAILPLDSIIGGVTYGKGGFKMLEQPFSPQELLELTAMLSAVRIAAASTPSNGGPWRVRKPFNPLTLLNAVALRRRQALPEVQVIQVDSPDSGLTLQDVLAQLEGPSAHLLPDRSEYVGR